MILAVQGVALMVDLCGRGFEESPKDDSHCVVRASWANKRSSEAWAWAGPLQVAGLAQEVMHPEDFGWSVTPTTQPLEGCISHLTLNGQVRSRKVCSRYVQGSKRRRGRAAEV